MDKKELKVELDKINAELNKMKGGYNSQLHNYKSASEFVDHRIELKVKKEEIINKLKGK